MGFPPFPGSGCGRCLRPLDFFLAFLSSILLFASYPPLGLGFLAFAAFIPLLSAIEGKSARQGFAAGFLAGFILSVGMVYWLVLVPVEWWVRPLIWLGILLLSSYLALYWGLFCFGVSLVLRRIRWLGLLVIPFLFVALEYVRSLSSLGFPWGLVGYTQTGYPQMIQFASFTGVWGVSFWVVAVNALGYQALSVILRQGNVRGSGQERDQRARVFRFLPCAAGIGLLVLIPYLHGRAVLSRADAAPTVRVALIQGNIPMDVKWNENYIDYNVDTYIQMSRRAAVQHPQLIIWPETAVPVVLRYEPRVTHQLLRLNQELGIPILTGVPEVLWRDGKETDYNRTVLISGGAITPQTYDKIHLVPFSERLPFLEVFPFLHKVDLGQAEFTPGSDLTVFDASGVRFSVLICFEAIFPGFVRRFALGGAQILVNITNDTWFGRTPAPYVHAAMAAFRAVENRRAVARCANSGISMLVDPYGRVLKRTPLFAPAIVVGSLPLRQETTFYARHGDFLPLLCGIALLAVVLAQRIGQRQPGKRRD